MENLEMPPSFWKDKRVFITGHTGFKGGWLSLWLKSLGAKVTGFSLDIPTEPSFYKVTRVYEGLNSLRGEIRDFSFLKNTILEHRPEILIHMAALPLVRYSYEHPLDTLSTNILGSIHILEAVRQSEGVRVVINVTSDKCYENQEWVWGYREIDPMGGNDPYSSSKGCSELITTAYRKSFFQSEVNGKSKVALGSARAGNVIGGGDWSQDRLIPDMVRSFINKQPVVIRNPKAVRPWQHVLDPLNGYMTLAEKLWEHGGKFADSWNFGPHENDSCSVENIAAQATEQWGEGATWEMDTASSHHEASQLRLDCAKAKNNLGWVPLWTLKRSIQKTVEWYKAHLNEQDMKAFTLQQISEYQSDIQHEPTFQI